jgi:hypothetical protein
MQRRVAGVQALWGAPANGRSDQRRRHSCWNVCTNVGLHWRYKNCIAARLQTAATGALRHREALLPLREHPVPELTPFLPDSQRQASRRCDCHQRAQQSCLSLHITVRPCASGRVVLCCGEAPQEGRRPAGRQRERAVAWPQRYRLPQFCAAQLPCALHTNRPYGSVGHQSCNAARI